jgi:hypothetical protein
LRDGFFVGAKIEPGAQSKSEIGAVSGNAKPGEHPAEGDRPEIGEQIEEKVAVHMPAPEAQSVFKRSGYRFA